MTGNALFDPPGILKLVIPGRPTTKKNSARVVKRGKFTKVLPSEAFEQYEKIALLQLRRYKNVFDGPVSMKCLYWLPDRRWWPDLVGLLQATSDILEKAGILENDRLIRDYDGSHIAGLSKNNPRAEIIIIPKPENDEAYQLDPFVVKKQQEKASVSLF